MAKYHSRRNYRNRLNPTNKTVVLIQYGEPPTNQEAANLYWATPKFRNLIYENIAGGLYPRRGVHVCLVGQLPLWSERLEIQRLPGHVLQLQYLSGRRRQWHQACGGNSAIRKIAQIHDTQFRLAC